MINQNMLPMFVLNRRANVCRGVFTFIFKAIRLGTTVLHAESIIFFVKN